MTIREKMDEYLDGALDAAGCAEVDATMARDPAMAAAFRGIKAQRALRAAAYESYRPSAAETATLVARFHDACAAPVGRIGPRPWLRWTAGAAAALALLVGTFAIGRMSAAPQIVEKEVVRTNYSVVTVDFSGDTRVHTFDTQDESREFIANYEAHGNGIAVAEIDQDGHM